MASILKVDTIQESTSGVGLNINSPLTTSGGFIPSSSLSLRNKIINGNFDFWQRGTSLGSGSGLRFLADRWATDSLNSTYTASQQAFTLGQTSVPHEPSFFHRIVVTSVAGASSYCINYYKIESVRTLAGKTATLSFWAKADSNKNIAVEFDQIFGTGGSPSSRLTGIGVTTCSLTTSWQKFTVTVSVPSIVGKTLGTNGNDSLGVLFWFDAGSNWNSRTNSLGQQSGTFDIAQVQLEEGNVATPFEVRPQGLELSLCQRYFYSSVNNAHQIAEAWNTLTNGSYGGVISVIPFPIEMRRNADVTVYTNTARGNPGNILVNNTTASTAFSLTATKNGFQLWNNGAASSNGYWNYYYDANAEL